MLIGVHVSTAGGLTSALGRAEALGGEAMQLFNQSPRMWRPTGYTEDDFAAFRQAAEGSPVRSAVIHAVYLINCASADPEIRTKSLASLTHALRVGDGIGADGVVLHAGSRKGEPYRESVDRAGEVVREALAETDRCPLLFENTAGTTGPLGRDFSELADLVGVAGGGDRIGVCIDCCHLLAAGIEIRTREALAAVVDELDARVGLGRLRCLHVNDSKVPLGRNLDRHANLGAGELGEDGIAVFLSEPRFERLPALIETPGPGGKGPDAGEVATARRLRRRGIAERKR